MFKFDYYEFVGYLIPGGLFLYIVSIFFPDFVITKSLELDFSNFGIYLLLSYGVGFLVQAVGDIFEKLYWSIWGGLPTLWVLKSSKHKNKICHDEECLLSNRISKQFNISEGNMSTSAKNINHLLITFTSKNDSSGRLYKFNGNYGLIRGMVVIILFGLISSLIETGLIPGLQTNIILFILLVLSIYKFHLFGIKYAQEVFSIFSNMVQK